MHLHWDGDNDSVDERNLSAALGAGVTPVTVDHAGLKRVRDWIWTLPPPAYPVSRRPGAGRARRAALPAALRRVPRRPPLPRRRQGRRARRPGRADRHDRHRPPPARFVHARRSPPTSTGSIRTRRTASRTSGRPTATPTIRSTASGCAARICTTARCRRCATCSSRPSSARRCSIAATTCSTRRRSASCRTSPADGGQTFTRYDTSRARQRQRRPPLRHDAVRRRQAGDRRIHEDVSEAS